MVSKLSRRLFNDAVGDPLRRKALAFAIYLKNHNGTSVFKDWSYRDLSRASGLSVNTCKKRVQSLRVMHLIREESFNGHRYLIFKKLRRKKIKNKKNNLFHTPIILDISIKNFESIKAIEKYLMALDIQEHTRKVEYTKRLITLATDPAPFTRDCEIKKAKAIWRKRGIEEVPQYTEYGYSHRRIMRRLHCGPQTVKYIISLGESLEMFIARQRDLVLVKYVGNNSARAALPYYKDEFPSAFATNNNIYYKPATIFSLLGD